MIGERPLIFSTLAYEPLRAAVSAEGRFDDGVVARQRFPDGEHYLRVDTSVEGRDVILLGGTPDDETTLELYDLASGLVECGARRLTLIVPYFGCSTMDRAVKPREVVTAKTRARLLSSIPSAAYGNRVFLVDLHTEGLTHYFEGGIRAVHVYAKPLITQAARDLGGEDFVLACTDAGRAKWVESLANDLGVTASFVFKRRLDGARTAITAVSAQVEGRTVIIYDDMIRTGGSLVQAAQAYREAGARRIAAIATHGVFPGDALDRIRDSGELERVVVTDSHPRAAALASDFLEVRTLSDLLVDALRRRP
jgi:ribose-phosphate pyrophosphokinase